MILLRNNLWLYAELSFCTVSLMACLIVLPNLFEEMNELHDYVFESVKDFKVISLINFELTVINHTSLLKHDMDAVWDDLMDYQSTHHEIRGKRSQYYEPPMTREYCNCGKMPTCNKPGPEDKFLSIG